MDKESTSKLRFDTRLTRRRGWIDQADLDRQLASLPDVSSKVAHDDEPDAGEDPTPEPDATATPSPIAGPPESGGS